MVVRRRWERPDRSLHTSPPRFRRALRRPASGGPSRHASLTSQPAPSIAGAARASVCAIAGWVVAAVVIGLSLVSTLADRDRRAAAVDGHRSTAREAIGLMTVPGTRVVAFIPRKTGVGRATLIVNPVQHRALLLADQIPPEAAPRLRLWGARGPNVPTPLAPVSFVAADGIAAADLGSALFEPAPPDQLVLSADGPDATSPGDVLLTAATR